MERNKPDYVFEMQADLDYTQTPWVQLGNPTSNPNRILKFTPPLYEPVWNNWMVSAIYPIYHNEKWIGTIGEDMQLTNALSFIFESSSRHTEEQHFLIDSEGNFVLAGKWQELLEKDFDQFKNIIKKQHQLYKLFDEKKHKDSWIFSNSSLKLEDVLNAKPLEYYRSEIQSWLDKYPITAFNMKFDTGFMETHGFKFKVTKCLMEASKKYNKNIDRAGRQKTPSVPEIYSQFFPDEKYDEEHRGADDAYHEGKILLKLVEFKQKEKELQI
jgi:hypothetical protein